MEPGLEDILMRLKDACPEVFPGAVLHVWQGPQSLLQVAVGSTANDELTAPVDVRTVFDLASLTKPLVTTAIMMRLVDAKQVGLEDSIERHLESLARTALGGRSVASLLSHTSGLPAWRPWGEDTIAAHGTKLAGTPGVQERFLEAIAAEPLAPAGIAAEYSDLGYMVLGWLVESVLGCPLDEAFTRLIAEPLGLCRTFFVRVRGGQADEPPCPIEAVAPTEVLNARGGEIRAAVHDDNAFVLGGVAGHAGLFSIAGEVAAILQAMIEAWRGNEGGLWQPETVRLFWEWGGAPPGSTWRLGFDTPSTEGSSCGTRAPAGAIGHLGFTGTSFWLHPESGTGVVLLTNRVHPSRTNEAIRAFRPALHDAIWDVVLG